MRVGDARDRRDAPPQLLGHAQVRRPVVADGANVDLRRQAEIEDLGDDVGGLEIEGHLGEGGRQHLAQLAHIFGGRRVALLERDQDYAVIDADGRAVGEGQIVGARRQPDIVDDQSRSCFGNDLANLVLDRLEDRFGRLDAGPGRRADVELDLAAVDGRKEIAADEHQHHSAEREHQDGDDRNDERRLSSIREQLDIALAHALEAALEGAMEAGKTGRAAARRRHVLALEQQTDDDRRQRPRQAVGRQHREHDGEPERREQILRRPFEEDDRGEDAADRERRDQGRHRDAGGAVQRRLRQRHPLLGEQSMRVLDRHRESSTRMPTASASPPSVIVLSVSPRKYSTTSEVRIDKRDRDHDDQRRTPRAEKQQDHQRGQPGGDRALAQHARHRCGDEHRLVEQLVDLEAGRRGGARDLAAPL